MASTLAISAAWILQAYLSIGLVVGILFISLGVAKIDAAAQGSSIWFRLIILPGSILLWPVVLLRWVQKLRSS